MLGEADNTNGELPSYITGASRIADYADCPQRTSLRLCCVNEWVANQVLRVVTIGSHISLHQSNVGS